jgi:hypothetical protein
MTTVLKDNETRIVIITDGYRQRIRCFDIESGKVVYTRTMTDTLVHLVSELKKYGFEVVK